jgi:GNAT superfamily N-acetyltransferase
VTNFDLIPHRCYSKNVDDHIWILKDLLLNESEAWSLILLSRGRFSWFIILSVDRLCGQEQKNKRDRGVFYLYLKVQKQHSGSQKIKINCLLCNWCFLSIALSRTWRRRWWGAALLKYCSHIFRTFLARQLEVWGLKFMYVYLAHHHQVWNHLKGSCLLFSQTRYQQHALNPIW